MKLQNGFTLIEMMITVAVIAILAAIAVPSYTQYVLRGKITEATTNLSDLRVKMEQWYQDSRTYIGGPCVPAAAGVIKYFTLSCPAVPTATTFTIQAAGGVAGGDQSMAGFTYTINQNNTKTTTIAAPADTAKWGTGSTSCWISKPQSC